MAMTAMSLMGSMQVNAQKKPAPFNVFAESFADLQVLRYQVPGFQKLTPKEKELVYYLYEAAMSGRDIIYDQKSKNGILLRKTIEAMYAAGGTGTEWNKFTDYCGRFWFSNGNHHHYGNEKFIPECTPDFFKAQLLKCKPGTLPKEANEDVIQFWTRVKPLFYDLSVEPKCVDLRADIDNVVASSNNFYEGVTQKEVEAFYDKMPTSGNAPSWGLNSKVVKENGVIKEKVWKSGGMYGPAIDRIIYWLSKAQNASPLGNQTQCINACNRSQLITPSACGINKYACMNGR